MSRLRLTPKREPQHSNSIRMGEMSVANDGRPLRSLLGSCVGVALYDRHHAAGGLAHIVLPLSDGRTDALGKFVDTAIPQLVEELQGLLGSELQLTAKLAGGASMFKASTTSHIGRQNVEASAEMLKRLGIPIIAQHCGGEKGRKMVLSTATGRVTIEVIGQAAFEM